jgi:hypothetical protein
MTVNNKLERMWKWSWPNLWCYPRIFFTELKKKPTKISVRIVGISAETGYVPDTSQKCYQWTNLLACVNRMTKLKGSIKKCTAEESKTA